MGRTFIREKKIYCGGKFLEVDIYPYSEERAKAVKGKRSKKETISAPKQANLNDKNAKRYLTWLANSNFDENDLHITATYTSANLPPSIEEAEQEARNFLRRVAYLRKKKGLPPLKYIIVTECAGKDGEPPKRVHHHIIMNGGLERDEVESLWRKRKRKGQKQGDKIGYINADRIQPDENGLAALSNYLTKNPNGKRRWNSSQNLIKPQSRTNDYAYSRKRVEAIAKNPPPPQFWEKRYNGYTPVGGDYGFRAEHNELTGWAVYLVLRKRE
jgi:hypothetical protein